MDAKESNGSEGKEKRNKCFCNDERSLEPWLRCNKCNLAAHYTCLLNHLYQSSDLPKNCLIECVWCEERETLCTLIQEEEYEALSHRLLEDKQLIEAAKRAEIKGKELQLIDKVSRSFTANLTTGRLNRTQARKSILVRGMEKRSIIEREHLSKLIGSIDFPPTLNQFGEKVMRYLKQEEPEAATIELIYSAFECGRKFERQYPSNMKEPSTSEGKQKSKSFRSRVKNLVKKM